MAKNTGKGYRKGAVKDRSQVETPVGWVKRDAETGRFLDVKSDGEPFKGVRREHLVGDRATRSPVAAGDQRGVRGGTRRGARQDHGRPAAQDGHWPDLRHLRGA